MMTMNNSKFLSFSVTAVVRIWRKESQIPKASALSAFKRGSGSKLSMDRTKSPLTTTRTVSLSATEMIVAQSRGPMMEEVSSIT